MRKNMKRTTWARLTDKEQVIRDFACGDKKGKISLFRITGISEPLARPCGGGRAPLRG